jgi:hypothetical protein
MTKVIPLREEYRSLTGDTNSALILNQFIYYVRSDHKYLQEEMRNLVAPKKSQEHGWIKKSASEIKDDLFESISSKTVERRLKDLSGVGYLAVRNSTFNKWDRSKEYRVNLSLIHAQLQELGYEITILSEIAQNNSVQSKKDQSEMSNALDKMSNQKEQFDARKTLLKKEGESRRPSDCMNEIRPESNFSQNEFYQTFCKLAETVVIYKSPIKDCLEDVFVLSQQKALLDQMYLGLIKNWATKNNLSKEIIEQALLLFDIKCRETRVEIRNPVGLFIECYKDAIKLYKANRT